MKKIVVLVGGSGSGKSTIAMELEKRGFCRLVTTTTRPMREGEVNHVHYHFVSYEEFWKIDRVEENEYVGHWYGLSKAEVDAKMELYDNLVIVMDENGAKAMKKEYGNIVHVVFITISPEVMKERMIKRGDSKRQIWERLKRAYDFNEFESPDIADLTINNVNLEESIKKIINYTKKEAY